MSKPTKSWKKNKDGTETKTVRYKDGSGHSSTTKGATFGRKLVAHKSWGSSK